MKVPTLPPNERERLLALQGLHLLDSAIENRFERITRLARNTFKVQIAAISLVDVNRQWFKSIQGLDVCETGRDVSFCGHALHDDRIFEISDAREDPRFHDNPLVTEEPFIRFYAGKPIHSPDGYRIGTLCLIDPNPRQLNDDEREMLEDLAGVAESQIELRGGSRTVQRLAGRAPRSNVERDVDPLTRVWTETAIREIAAEEVAGASPARPVSLLMVTIDRLAQIEQQHGNDAGAAVLRESVGRVLGQLGLDDALGRVGRGTFLAVCGDLTPEISRQTADTIVQLFADNPMTTADAWIPVSVTTAVGPVLPNGRVDPAVSTLARTVRDTSSAGGNRAVWLDRLGA